MRTLPAILIGLLLGAYVALIFHYTGDLVPAFNIFNTPAHSAISFLLISAVYALLATLFDDWEGGALMALAWILLPIIGTLACLVWSLVLAVFGGGFDATIIPYGTFWGTIAAFPVNLMIANAMLETLNSQHRPPARAHNSQQEPGLLATFTSVVKRVKIGGSIVGHGVEGEVEFHDRARGSNGGKGRHKGDGED